METHKNTPYYNLFPAKQGKKEQHWKQTERTTLRHLSEMRSLDFKCYKDQYYKINICYSGYQTDCRIFKCELTAPTISVRLRCSRFLKLHQHTVTVFWMEKHHWFPMSAYSGLRWQSSDVLRFQVDYCSVNVVYLEIKRKIVNYSSSFVKSDAHSITLIIFTGQHQYWYLRCLMWASPIQAYLRVKVGPTQYWCVPINWV